MKRETADVVRQVLREASDHAGFAGWSFAARLVWMIGRGCELGRRQCEGEVPASAPVDAVNTVPPNGKDAS